LPQTPARILLAGATGASDLYWYVPTASPLKTSATSPLSKEQLAAVIQIPPRGK
jgi:hypothetical protein